MIVNTRTHVNIHGVPKLSVWFEGLPSMNTYYNMNRWTRSSRTAEWRYEARQKAYEWTLFMKDFLVQRALVVVNVYPSVEEIMDIHNVVIKPILDGFSDAGVYQDDEFAFCPIVMYRWAGKGEHKPRQHRIRKTRIDVYELTTLTIGGEAQILPKGRKRYSAL